MRSKFALLLLALLTLPATVHAQARDPEFPVCGDQAPYAFALRGDTLLVGGAFDHMGPNSGSFVALDPLKGRLRPHWPRVLGDVHAIASDGSGGWFVGGSFHSVAGVPRTNLAHIRADGTLDDFDPAPNRDVLALAYSAGVLYVGGSFTSVGGVARNRLAALNTGSGLVTPWNPDASGPVDAILVHNGQVFVGGEFNFVSGAFRLGLAELDPVTGAATLWSPSDVLENKVFALAARNDTLLVGGTFTGMAGQSRSNLAMLSTTTTSAFAWNPGADASVFSIALVGGTVYAGGNFFNAGGQPRIGLAALDLGSGAATGWSPPPYIRPRAIVVSGGTVYAGGSFGNLPGTPRYSGLVALSAATGQIAGPVLSANSGVNTLAFANGTLFAGGFFDSCPVAFRNGIGAIDLKTKQVLDWRPDAGDGTWVRAMVMIGDTLYVGGQFTQMGGQPRKCLAAVSLTTGTATPFAAGEEIFSVSAVAASHDTLYMSGGFVSFSGQSRLNAAAVNVHTGTLTGWAPEPDGLIKSIVPEPNAVYAAGDFGQIGGIFQTGLAALDPATGLHLWPMNSERGTTALAKYGNTLYVGGDFGRLEGALRPRLGAYDVSTHQLLPWNPNADHFLEAPIVRAFALSDDQLYVGGKFNTIGGQPRQSLASFDLASRGQQAWAPLPGGPEVSALIGADGLVVAGLPLSRTYMEAFYPEASSFPSVTVVAPAPGTTLNTGSTYRLAWNASASAPGIQSADVYLSRTGAAGPWKLLAAGVRSHGGYDWLVTGPNAIGTCFLRVDARDWQGRVVSHVSPAGFSIGTGVTAVEPPTGIASWALGPLSPNPLRGQGQFAFDAPRAAPVRIALHDVQGRVVRVLSDGVAEAGHHVVRLDKDALAPGIYLMRLQAPGVDLMQRVAVLR